MSRITTKQFNGWRKARREWISENDEYNRRVFGITKAEYTAISAAAVDAVGPSFVASATLADINRRLA